MISSLVSVIIPACDRDHLLKNAVNSVLSQSLLPAKILIVDNGLHEVNIKFDDTRVTIVRTPPRIGPGKSRNIGVNACGTAIIAFLDDDDLWDPKYLEYTMAKFEQTDADIVVGQLKRKGLDGLVRDYKMFPEGPERQRSVFYRNEGFGGTNIAMRKDVFVEIGGFDECMPASVDRDLAAKLLIAGKKICTEPKAIAVACDHNGTRVRTKQVKGNWMFIRKYWKHMHFNERRKALKTLLLRYALHCF